MSRKEFLDELAFLLQDIPLVEQLEALQYYNDYFDDAGPEAEQDIIKELESPAKVAAMVKGGVSEEDGEFTERGYSNPHYRGPSYEMVEKEKQRRDKADQGHPYSEEGGSDGGQKSGSSGRGMGGLLVVLFIIGFPVIIAVLSAVFAVMVGVASVMFAVGIVLAVLLVAFLGTGILCIAAGLAKLFTLPLTGALFCGTGSVLIGLGLLSLVLCILYYGKVLPACMRGLGSMFNWSVGLFRRRRSCV